MKRTLILLGALSVGTAYSQSHKVGINTDNPRASLEVSKAAGIAATEVQGFILPQLTQAERNGMDKTKFVQGLQIYNTDKKCVDIWTGSHWQCSDGTKQDNQGDTPSTPSAVYAITQLGFGGVYKADEALTSDNTVTFKIKNTGAVTSPTMNLSSAVTITNEPGGSVGVISGQHSSVTIAPGREVTLTYRLTGTPKAGNLKAKLTYNTVYDEATTPVAIEVDPIVPQYVTLLDGERSFVSVYDEDYWPYSGPTTATAQTTDQYVDGNLDEPTIDIQGKITTTGTEVYIPVTIDPAVGHHPINVSAFPGSEIPVSANYTEDGNSRNIKLSWEAQTINKNSTYIKAKISAVGQDLLLKKLDFNSGMGQDYKGIEIATFRYATTQGGTQRASFVVRLMPGIPDRRFAIKTKGSGGTDVYDHQFIYVPVKDPRTDISYGGQIWLNNNLGAEYTRVGSSVFDPGQQAKEHRDYNAFGSLFQWGRPADGHELVTYTSATNWSFKYGTTTTPTATYPPQPAENQTVIPTVTANSDGVDTTPMWFTGTSKPTSFPITVGDDDNAVCPKGFKVPNEYYLNYLINRTKSFDRIKEFFVRLPSNRFNNTDNTTLYPDGNGYYSYGPKLWIHTNNNGYRHQNQYVSGSTLYYKYMQVEGTTDFAWDSATQKWRYSKGSGESEISSLPWVYSYGGGKLRASGSGVDNFYRKWAINSYSSSTYAMVTGGVPHTVSSSLAIRCIKS